MVTGIIAEYNPLTNGHKYQLDQARAAGSDYIIAVMSGDFLQRGEPAIIDKYARTAMALRAGVDLVIELPVCFATADAGHFASGGVSMLHRLGVVDELSFGVEPGLEQLVTRISDFLLDPPTAYDEALDLKLRNGLTFPQAREQALSLFFTPEEIRGIDRPNVILGIEYMKALRKLGSSISPHPISRKGAEYDDASPDSTGMSSASGIRAMIRDCFDPDDLSSQLPQSTLDILCDAYGHTFPIFPEDCSSMLHYKLLTSADYSVYSDITPAFSDHIRKNLENYNDYNSFVDSLKSRNITRASVNRLLSHILLDMKLVTPKCATYARVLGFRESATPLLSQIKKQASIPMITKLADAADNPYIQQDIMAADIYEAIKLDNFSAEPINEYRRQLIIL